MYLLFQLSGVLEVCEDLLIHKNHRKPSHNIKTHGTSHQGTL